MADWLAEHPILFLGGENSFLEAWFSFGKKKNFDIFALKSAIFPSHIGTAVFFAVLLKFELVVQLEGGLSQTQAFEKCTSIF